MLKSLFFYTLRLFAVVAIGGSLWFVGLILFTRMIPSLPEDTVRATDGIVIFTGGETRLKVALALFEQHKGKYLLISGVNPQSTLSEMVNQMPYRSQVTLGYKALDTLGNAEETAVWARSHSLKSLRLITSNYHMPRSLFELRHLLPDTEIIPHPVMRQSFYKKRWWLDPVTLGYVIQEYNKFLFALIRRPLEDLQDYFTSEKKG